MDIIASSITFVSSIISAYRAIDRLNQLPREFREVEQRLPLVRQTLATINTQLDANHIDTPTETAIARSVTQCDEYGLQLKSIFEDIGAYDKREGSALVRYKNTLVSKGKQLGKAHRVEALMTGMLNCVRDLAENRVFYTATHAQVSKLAIAIDALSHTKSSVPDSDFDKMNTSASQNIGSGGLGSQGNQFGDGTFYNSGGNNNNSGGGPIFNSHVGEVNFEI
ncbi:ankyrin repeat protein [Ophiostoma piceae UAMH 11346]|uniref:Ankyrin repeat protein n=1 Tax=Ophiostoma piceae (strain UAMH 11346) TaxID=1262450 RepID=S3BQI2_OPHP1|nr:ankyrin repeat protein [Ophiostoma piceae UAMH 11346]